MKVVSYIRGSYYLLLTFMVDSVGSLRGGGLPC
ncbi:hypothetical protein Gohar_011110, partial [Gossypium harknessii]|nr:hypothetical protein [Gossypium harknessii]